MRLAEQNTVLRVVDSGFDGIIADMKGEINPITSNIFRIIECAFKMLGSTEFTHIDNVLSFRIPERTRLRLLSSKAFFDSEGRGRYAFENIDDSGRVCITTAGKNATFGPLDRFFTACEYMLFQSENLLKKGSHDFDIQKLIGTPPFPNGDHGIATSVNQIGESDLVAHISDGKYELTNWFIGDSNTIEAM